MATGTIKRNFGRSVHYSGTTDANGNLEIPTSTVNPIIENAVPMYAQSAYLSGVTYAQGKLYAKLLKYDGTKAASTAVTVYFLV